MRAALGHLRQALAPDEFNPQTDGISFRIAMADATAAAFMPTLVDEIERSRAMADLRILPLTHRDPRPLLERGDADVAVGSFPETLSELRAQGNDASFHHQRLSQSDYVCVMRHDHPLAKRRLSLDAYCAAHHLLVSLSGRPHGLVDQALASLNRERRIVLTVNQYFTAGRVVANSNLLTVLPGFFVEATGFREKVITRPLPFGLPSLFIDMLWHQRHDRSSSHQWLRHGLLDAARSAPA